MKIRLHSFIPDTEKFEKVENLNMIWVPEDFGRFQKVPESSRRFQKTPERFQKVSEDSGRLKI